MLDNFPEGQECLAGRIWRGLTLVALLACVQNHENKL
jgi:hypothetical protein